MTNKPFLSRYSGESIDALLDMEVRYRIDSLVVTMEEALTRKRMRLGDRALSDEELVVLSVEALEREVNNGGFNQFFFNPSNEFAPRVVADLRRIDCEETARITEQEIDALELPEFNPVAIRNRAAESDDKLDEALEDLDFAYYAQAEDIAGKLFVFVKLNKDKFSIP
jgi:hypothetical protein